MSTTRCERARELIPDFVAGRLEGPDVALVEAHLPRCPECSAEAELVRMLLATRPAADAAAGVRLREAVLMAVRRSGGRPAWALLAASVAALAIGIGVVASGEDATGGAEDLPAYVEQTEEATLWISEDGLIAGGLVLDELSEEDLTALLAELSAGGAA